MRSFSFFSTSGIAAAGPALPSFRIDVARPLISGPLACVMGDMDLVRPLGLAGVRCAVVAPPGNPALHSRFVASALPWEDFEEHEEDLVAELLRLAYAQREPPVLFYEEDSHLLLVSRNRERLARAFRFVIADPVLVEDLVDKERFHALAERLRLPVAPTRAIRPHASAAPTDLDLPYPLIVKPLTRRKAWGAIVGGEGKAIRVESPDDLRAVWPRLAATRATFLAQRLIPGGEERIESYHVYVDAEGKVAGEFTGQKIRTNPAVFGLSTALKITDAQDVRALGRDLTERLGLRGVAKFDFKRDPAGRLHLLEVNPRFNLWHHLGAVAGVNLPALVYVDLIGRPRPQVGPATPGMVWSILWKDYPVARASGISLRAWLKWALRCQAKSVLAWDDPLPALYRVGARWLRRGKTRVAGNRPQSAPQARSAGPRP